VSTDKKGALEKKKAAARTPVKATAVKAAAAGKAQGGKDGKDAKVAAKPVAKAATSAKASAPAKAAGKAVAAKAAAAAPAKAATKAAKAKTVARKAGKAREADDQDLELDAEAANDSDDESAEAPARKGKGKAGTTALVVVESPAKANTIKKYLGSGYVVKASVGHVKDLPRKTMGIDIANDFAPEYEVIEGKKKVLAEIKTAAKKAARVLLAPDPDREGEAIAWHIADELRPSNPNIQRVLFNEITKKAVNEAILRPLELDAKKFESQQARRILDRLVGYEISPVLWAKVKRGLSAGRVQSVAVRLVVDREAEIQAFKPEEYWTIDALVEGAVPPPFTTRVVKLDGQKAQMTNQAETQAIVELVQAAQLVVASVERKERRKFAPPPFITSKLQQEASSKLRFSPKRTMGLAQRLYEGLEMGEEGPVGLITYMRTDSTRLSDDAIADVRSYIAGRYGSDRLPAEPNTFKSKKSAQDAHEAIRPTSTRFDPETVRQLMTASGGRDPREIEDLIKLYTLIWNRFVACQMIPAVFDQTAIDIEAGRVGLRATGQVIKVPGFLEVYAETVEDAASEDESTGNLPEVREGEVLRLVEAKPEQHFTQPPPRFSEATLVKELEEKGIGRPSTYAAILSTVQDRGYVEKRENRLYPTELGVMVNGLLVKSFPEIVSTDFTAQMEERLDEVEEGRQEWVPMLRDFYGPFQQDVKKAKVEMRDVKREEIPTEHVCEKCGKVMVIKWGRNGHFLACSGYPECRNTKEYVRAADGSIQVVATTRETNEKCPTCGSTMLIRRGRFGEFLACSKYPECKTTSPISIGVACPRPNCGGYLTEKRSRRGKIFFGCANYSKTKCDFVSWDRPVPRACPSCNAAFIVEKVSKAGVRLRCIAEGCGYSADKEDVDQQPAAGEATAGTTAPPPAVPPDPDAKAS
jgi:DNA topoisomerase-1